MLIYTAGNLKGPSIAPTLEIQTYIETHSDTLEIYSNKFETLLFLLVIDGDTADPQDAPGVPFKGAFIPPVILQLLT